MGRQSNQSKAIEWQKRLRRFEACNLTVARFCARERVTEPTFWYWRRKSAGISPPSEPSPPAFAPVDVVGGRSVPLRFPAGAVLGILPASLRIHDDVSVARNRIRAQSVARSPSP